GFAWATARLKRAVRIPVIASNRIATPAQAEAVLAAGQADMISMARPLLADPDFAVKADSGRAASINVCIACNQACLDHYFTDTPATCLVNPRACRETELNWTTAGISKKVAVIGGGPAGLACAVTAAERGHRVTIFEASPRLGGQFNLAKVVPGKEIFADSIAYHAARLDELGAIVRLGRRATAASIAAERFDRVVVATGILPRRPAIAGIDHHMVAGYAEILDGSRAAGRRVVIMGAGGIGFDVALFLLKRGDKAHLDPKAFAAEWGIDMAMVGAGGLTSTSAPKHEPAHSIAMLKRSEGPFGATLGRSTGWVHRAVLARAGVTQLAGVTYRRIDDGGVHVTLSGEDRVIAADTVVICAGQEPLDSLHTELRSRGVAADLIGGARLASELDAKRAIEEGVRLAAEL
ncbi:MAG TPA: FAD-dependent oxidoreductase, partial [Candidatus Cybelea sp.]|nr:FAD-dependent oxidoreductase [Candidatus Cybelea sp.]